MKGPRTSRFEARRRLIAVAVLTLALPAALPLHASPDKRPSAANAPSVQVQTQPLERRALDATLTGYGIILGLGIVGEYIGRIYQEVRGRPRFVIREIIEGTDKHPHHEGGDPAPRS